MSDNSFEIVKCRQILMRIIYFENFTLCKYYDLRSFLVASRLETKKFTMRKSELE